MKTKNWDAAAALDTPERIALYLEEAFEDGDPQLISAAIGDVARAHGMTQRKKPASRARRSTAP
jgi:probable addiction module antidote protein